MFLQIIRGKTHDAEELRGRLDEWRADLAGGASGWLGSTAGVAGDGRFVAMVRFESAEAARRNSDRPEQGEWWSKTEPLLDDVEFVDTEEVLTMLGGADPSAGFVQVMESRVTDPERARALFEDAERNIPKSRPDVTGILAAVHGDRLTQAVYFTDEAAARQGEASEPSEEDRAAMEAMAAAFADTTYLDLANPWHHRP